MIPKTIHYCWFGGNTLPPLAKKCINSWKKFFPDYEIKEWNESNFNVNSIPYTKDAYSAGKYAFVSDYARYKILYEHGGLYFDTDVEVIKSFDEIINAGAFMGCESKSQKGNLPRSLNVNPGLGIGSSPGLSFYKVMIEQYESLNFFEENGLINNETIVTLTSKALEREGLLNKDGIQKISGIYIYPPQFFCPFDDLTGRLHVSDETHSIHWFNKSWIETSNTRVFLSRIIHRIFGTKFIYNLKKMLIGKS